MFFNRINFEFLQYVLPALSPWNSLKHDKFVSNFKSAINQINAESYRLSYRHGGLSKMVAILQTTFSHVIS